MASDTRTTGPYARTAEHYELVYAGDKDYASEAHVLAGLIREARPDARCVLDVACGTGRHAEELEKLGFLVDGIDLEPQFIAAAAARVPRGAFHVADMTTFQLAMSYDAIVCLFSAIGYVRTPEALSGTLARMAAHLEPSGVVIVDPWFEPGQLTDRHVDASAHVADGVAVCKLSRIFVEGAISRLEFDYLIGRPDGVEATSETHTLGLFTQQEMESAFRYAGLEVERRHGVLRKRGVYIGRRVGSHAPLAE